MKKNKLICVASIGRPRGLKGEFFLNSFCNPTENILNYSHILKNEEVLPNLIVKYIRQINSKFYCKISNINDLESIKKYTNTNLYIDSKDLPELSNDEVYWHDLIGMRVIDQNFNEILGVVDGLNNFGSDDCLLIKPTQDSVDDQERLIPFIKDKFIKVIDKKNRLLEVDWKKDY